MAFDIYDPTNPTHHQGQVWGFDLETSGTDVKRSEVLSVSLDPFHWRGGQLVPDTGRQAVSKLVMPTGGPTQLTKYLNQTLEPLRPGEYGPTRTLRDLTGLQESMWDAGDYIEQHQVADLVHRTLSQSQQITGARPALVGHNIQRFDLPLIQRLAQATSAGPIDANVLDTYQYAKRAGITGATGRRTLSDLGAAAGYTPPGGVYHTAQGDNYADIHVYNWMRQQQNAAGVPDSHQAIVQSTQPQVNPLNSHQALVQHINTVGTPLNVPTVGVPTMSQQPPPTYPKTDYLNPSGLATTANARGGLRLGRTTLDATGIESQIIAGLQSLQGKGIISAQESMQFGFEWIGQNAQGQNVATTNPAAMGLKPLSKGAYAGAYQLQVSAGAGEQRQTMQIGVKGGFETGYTRPGESEAERALRLVLKGGGELNVGSYLNYEANANEYGRDLSIKRIERYTPGEQMALALVTSARAGAQNPDIGMERKFYDVMSTGSTDPTNPRRNLPGGILMTTPGDVRGSDVLPREYAQRLQVVGNTPQNVRVDTLMRSVNQALSVGLPNESANLRGVRVIKPEAGELVYSPTGDTVRVNARGINYTENPGEGGDAGVVPYNISKPWKYLYGYSKGSKFGALQPYQFPVEEAGGKWRPIEPAIEHRRIGPGVPLTGYSMPNMVMQPGMESTGEFLDRTFITDSKYASGAAILSRQRFLQPGVAAHVEELAGDRVDLSYIDDLRSLERDDYEVKELNREGKLVTNKRGVIDFMKPSAFGTPARPGQSLTALRLLQMGPDDTMIPSVGGPVRIGKENSRFAIAGATLTLPMYMNETTGAPVTDLSQVYDDSRNLRPGIVSTAPLAERVQQRFNKAGYGGIVNVTTANDQAAVQFYNLVQRGASMKAGPSTEKSGPMMGPENLMISTAGSRFELDDPNGSRSLKSVPLTKISGEFKSPVRGIMSGVAHMPREQQIELLGMLPNSTSLQEWMAGSTNEVLDWATTAKRYAAETSLRAGGIDPTQEQISTLAPKQTYTGYEMMQGLLSKMLAPDVDAATNQMYYDKFGIAKASGWVGYGTVSSATKAVYDAEAKRLQEETGETPLRRYIKMDKGRDPRYYMYEYQEGIIAPTAGRTRPEYPGGIHLSYETMFNIMDRYPQLAAKAGFLPAQGPFPEGGGSTKTLAKDQAWTSFMSSYMYRGMARQGGSMPSGANIFDITPDVATNILSTINKVDSPEGLGDFQRVLEEEWSRTHGGSQMPKNTLLHYQAGGMNEYTVTPGNIQAITSETPLGESPEHWPIMFQNLSAKLAEAVLPGDMADDAQARASEAAGTFYTRFKNAALGKKGQLARTLFGKTPTTGFSTHYQTLPGLGISETYAPPNLAAILAKQLGFKNESQMFKTIDEQHGGRFDAGMFFRYPVQSREGGVMAMGLVTPNYLKDKGIEIPTGPMAEGNLFVNDLINKIMSGDRDEDPGGFLLMGRYDQETGKLTAEVDKDFRRDINRSNKAKIAEAERIVRSLHGPAADEYNVLRKELVNQMPGVDKYQDIYNKLSSGGGRISPESLNMAVRRKALGDTAKGTVYNLGRTMESFDLINIPTNAAVGQAMTSALLGLGLGATDAQRNKAAKNIATAMRGQDAYPRRELAAKAISSLSSMYQPALDLDIGLQEGLTSVETMVNSARFIPLDNNQTQLKLRTKGSPPSAWEASVTGADQVRNLTSVWDSSQHGQGKLLQTVAANIAGNKAVSNEFLAYSLTSTPGGFDPIYQQLESIRDQYGGDEAAYMRERTAAIKGMTRDRPDPQNRGQTIPALVTPRANIMRSIVGGAAYRFAKESPELMDTAMVPDWEGGQKTLREYLYKPEVALPLLANAISTGNTGEIADIFGFTGMARALKSSDFGQSGFQDLAIIAERQLAQGAGMTAAGLDAYLNTLDMRLNPQDPTRVREAHAALYDKNQLSNLTVRMSGAYEASMTDATPGNYEMPGGLDRTKWSPALMRTLVGRFGGDPDKAFISGSEATRAGQALESTVYAAYANSRHAIGSPGQMALGVARDAQGRDMPGLRYNEATDVGTVTYTGHTDVLEYWNEQQAPGINQGHLRISDIKTRNISKQIEAIEAQNPGISREEAAKMAAAAERGKMLTKERKTQLSLYGKSFQGYFQRAMTLGGTPGAMGELGALEEEFLTASQYTGLNRVARREMFAAAAQGNLPDISTQIIPGFFHTLNGERTPILDSASIAPIPFDEWQSHDTRSIAANTILAAREAAPELNRALRSMPVAANIDELNQKYDRTFGLSGEFRTGRDEGGFESVVGLAAAATAGMGAGTAYVSTPSIFSTYAARNTASGRAAATGAPAPAAARSPNPAAQARPVQPAAAPVNPVTSAWQAVRAANPGWEQHFGTNAAPPAAAPPGQGPPGPRVVNAPPAPEDPNDPNQIQGQGGWVETGGMSDTGTGKLPSPDAIYLGRKMDAQARLLSQMSGGGPGGGSNRRFPKNPVTAQLLQNKVLNQLDVFSPSVDPGLDQVASAFGMTRAELMAIDPGKLTEELARVSGLDSNSRAFAERVSRAVPANFKQANKLSTDLQKVVVNDAMNVPTVGLDDTTVIGPNGMTQKDFVRGFGESSELGMAAALGNLRTDAMKSAGLTERDAQQEALSPRGVMVSQAKLSRAMDDVIKKQEEYTAALEKGGNVFRGTKKEADALTESVKTYSKVAREAVLTAVVAQETGEDVSGIRANVGAAQRYINRQRGRILAGESLTEGEVSSMETVQKALGAYESDRGRAAAQEAAERGEGGTLVKFSRRMLGGFGLMYLRSIGNIITSGGRLGYEESVQEMTQATAVMGGTLGGVSAAVNPEIQLQRARALYGGGGYSSLRQGQAALMQNQPALYNAGSMLTSGVAAGSLTAYALTEGLGMTAAAAGPFALLAGGAFAAGTGLMNAYGAYQNVNQTSWAAGARLMNGEEMRTPMVDRSGQGKYGEWASKIDSWVLGMFDPTKAAFQADEQINRNAEALHTMFTVEKSGGGVDRALKYLGITGQEAAELKNLYGLAKAGQDEFKNIPAEGVFKMQATSYRYGLNLPLDEQRQLATNLSAGFDYTKTAGAMLSAAGYSPAATEGGIGQVITDMLKSRTTEAEMDLVTQGAQRWAALGPMMALPKGMSTDELKATYGDMTKLDSRGYQLFSNAANRYQTESILGWSSKRPEATPYQREYTDQEFAQQMQRDQLQAQRANAGMQAFNTYAQLGIVSPNMQNWTYGRIAQAQMQAQTGYNIEGQLLQGGGGEQWSQQVGGAFTQMGAKDFSMYSGMIQNLNPLRWAQWAMKNPSAAQSFVWAGNGVQNTLPGLAGSSIPASSLFYADVNSQGQLTGMDWGSSSLALPGVMSSQQMATNIWGGQVTGGQWAPSGASGQGYDQGLINAMMNGGTRAGTLYQQNVMAGYQMAQAGIQMRGIELQEKYTPQFWAIEDKQRNLGYAYQEWQFGFQQRQMDSQNAFWQEGFGMNVAQAKKQRGWTKEDWAYQDQTRELQWQWKQEDYGESVRFMTGRDRRLAERQMGRDTTMYNLEGEQIDKQRRRQEELWKTEDKRFDLERRQHEASVKFQQEQLDRSREYFEDRKKLELEAIKLQRAYWHEQIALQKESAKVSAGAAAAQIAMNKTMTAYQQHLEEQNGVMKLITNETLVDMVGELQRGDTAFGNYIEKVKELNNLFDQFTGITTQGTGVKNDSQDIITPATGTGSGTGTGTGGTNRQTPTSLPRQTPDPWEKTVISNNRNLGASTGPMTIIVNVGNEKLEKYIVNVVGNEIEVK